MKKAGARRTFQVLLPHLSGAIGAPVIEKLPVFW